MRGVHVGVLRDLQIVGMSLVWLFCGWKGEGGAKSVWGEGAIPLPPPLPPSPSLLCQCCAEINDLT